MTLGKIEGTGNVERGSTRSHPVENSLWKKLQTWCKTHYSNNECTRQVDTNYSAPMMSTITFTFTEIVLAYLTFSNQRQEMYLFVPGTKVMFYTTAFVTLVTSRLPLFWNTRFLVHTDIPLSSKFRFRCKFPCSSHFQIEIEYLPHTYTHLRDKNRARHYYRYMWQGVKHYRQIFLLKSKKGISP
jgi:hypothetical protein